MLLNNSQQSFQVNRFGDIQDIGGRTIGRVDNCGFVQFNVPGYPSNGSLNSVSNRIDFGMNQSIICSGFDNYQREQEKFFSVREKPILKMYEADYPMFESMKLPKIEFNYPRYEPFKLPKIEIDYPKYEPMKLPKIEIDYPKINSDKLYFLDLMKY
jgi:hypothetical protein